MLVHDKFRALKLNVKLDLVYVFVFSDESELKTRLIFFEVTNMELRS